jgi:cysteine desulfurase
MNNNDNIIYLDHNATTPIEPEAVSAMYEIMKKNFGNPSSMHELGLMAKKIVDTARQEVASLLGCKTTELIFTSGGSESNNMAVKGLIDFRNPEKQHIIISAVEHPALLNPALYLMELGTRLTIVPVDQHGLVSPEDIEKAIRPETILISVMLANNETGAIQPIREISEIALAHSIVFHTDAAQAVGKIEVDVNELRVDLLSLAGHKLYGPKGIGALFIREGLDLTPLIHGANQEFGERAGTENVILAAGLGATCRIAKQRLKHDMEKMTRLRDRLQELLFEGIEGLVLNGHPNKRLPNTLNVSVPNIEGNKILEMVPNVIASTGAACHDRSVKLSHVLSAMGVTPEIGMGALRLSLGRLNNMDMIEKAADLIIYTVKRTRKL